ncbi:homoserine dehydrogenase [Glaciecola punicea ACAM 611]|jgi:homoserine dehydrogenase|uniref:Homoserine dehydrogenase n=1 Tax=Glaciecola punicea ACAM 611 TaxID=1121923 RepID=H5T8M2_9ALTE|nr:homoserine dehydrogenase [Glaciecola punicea]OFA29944.1 homoserine dehydrogenase [Glaciecola punicea]GAB54498.1 homoserine dehydrogenase [Glaciecola punicea ACAM 611]
MKKYKLAIIGFGNVGQGLAKIIRDKNELLSKKFGIELSIVAVCDLYKGSIANSSGLDPEILLSDIEKYGDLKSTSAPITGWNAIEMIDNSGADILIELAFTDLKTGEPALSHVKRALNNGMHVSMTNKGPVALHFPELHKLASSKNVQIGIEGTVMSGTPSIHLGKGMLLAAGITKIQGILNGTTNYILGEMSTGADYEVALKKAQELGYAEADPTGDVEGHDTAAKVVILGNLLMDLSLTLDDIDRTGISHITNVDISNATKSNKYWKLIGSVQKRDTGFIASVKPEMVSSDHPLAFINGATNAITYSTELLGDITLIGPGAGGMETGYAVIEDILSIHRSAPAYREYRLNSQ